MGWVSFREDLIESKNLIDQELPKFEKLNDKNEIKETLYRIEKIRKWLIDFSKSFEPIIDFITDPTNDNILNTLFLRWENKDLENKLKESDKLQDSFDIDRNKKVIELRQIINEHEANNKDLKLQIKSLKRERNNFKKELNNVYNKYPDISYDMYPPKNNHKDK